MSADSLYCIFKAKLHPHHADQIVGYFYDAIVLTESMMA